MFKFVLIFFTVATALYANEDKEINSITEIDDTEIAKELNNLKDNDPHSTTSEKKSKEELLVVQTVSKERRSFVIAKGIADGLIKGQEYLFSNENLSVVCRAIEVSRNYSLWTPVDSVITVPFNKDEFISYSSHNYGNIALDVIADINQITPTLDYNKVFKKFRTENNYSLKTSYNKGLTQSSSEVSTSKNTGRSGYTIELDYNYRFLPEFEMSIGGRIDNEVYRIQEPELDIPTSRRMVVLGATFHLVNFSNNENNYYLAIAAGIGNSTTEVNGDKSAGSVILLPEVRLGFLMPFSKSTALLIESSAESLNSKESFPDSTEQTTNILNFKLTLGLRF